MYCRKTIIIAFALQVYRHAPVTDGTIVFVIDFIDLILNFLFMGIVTRLPVFPVVIVCVWADAKPPQEPAQTKQLMIVLNKSIIL